MQIERVLWIGLGGFLGANLRYLVGVWADSRWSQGGFPAGTLLVNVAGCFLLGLVVTLLSERLLAGSHWRFLLAIGFLGSYTTFSTFSYESLKLMEAGSWWLAGLNLAGSVGLGLLGAASGIALARWL